MSGGSCAAGGCCLAMFGLLVLVQMPGTLMSDTDSDCLSEDDKGCEGALTEIHTSLFTGEADLP